MNIWIHLITLTVVLSAALATQASTLRDPFLPTKFVEKDAQGNAKSAPRPTATPVPKELSWQQKQIIAREEAIKLQGSLSAKGTMKFGKKLYVYIGTQWLSKNDSFTVERDGLKYRLVITELTEDNIQLEPVRVRDGNQQ